MSGKALLVSLRPRFAHAIYSGEKKFELRRTKPKGRFDRVYIYETAPVGAITGFFDVTSIRRQNKRRIWAEASWTLSLQKSEFDDYLKGIDLAVTIGIGSPVKLARPVSLMTALGSPDAPQSFRFLRSDEVTRILEQGMGHPRDDFARQTKISHWGHEEPARTPG